MAGNENNSWEKIQQGAKTGTKRMPIQTDNQNLEHSRGSGDRYMESRVRRQTATRSRKRSKSPGSTISIYQLLKLLLPVLCIILLILVVKLVKPESRNQKTEVSTEMETMADTQEAEQESEDAEPVYRTTDVLNVRPEPSTSSERIGQLNAGVTVDYVRAYDADWAVILYNGQEAYVASQYLTME